MGVMRRLEDRIALRSAMSQRSRVAGNCERSPKYWVRARRDGDSDAIVHNSGREFVCFVSCEAWTEKGPGLAVPVRDLSLT